MKYFVVVVLLALGLTMAGCGSNNSSTPANVNGNWNAMLTDANGTEVLSFGTSLVVNGDGTLSISHLTFNSNSGCFVSGETETGSFGLTGNFNGNVTGNFQMAVQSGTPSGNSLTLTGMVTGNTITGKWTLTGSSGCSGTGNFTMSKA